jgi:hypothetical protein
VPRCTARTCAHAPYAAQPPPPPCAARAARAASPRALPASFVRTARGAGRAGPWRGVEGPGGAWSDQSRVAPAAVPSGAACLRARPARPVSNGSKGAPVGPPTPPRPPALSHHLGQGSSALPCRPGCIPAHTPPLVPPHVPGGPRARTCTACRRQPPRTRPARRAALPALRRVHRSRRAESRARGSAETRPAAPLEPLPPTPRTPRL